MKTKIFYIQDFCFFVLAALPALQNLPVGVFCSNFSSFRLRLALQHFKMADQVCVLLKSTTILLNNKALSGQLTPNFCVIVLFRHSQLFRYKIPTMIPIFNCILTSNCGHVVIASCVCFKNRQFVEISYSKVLFYHSVIFFNIQEYLSSSSTRVHCSF